MIIGCLVHVLRGIDVIYIALVMLLSFFPAFFVQSPICQEYSNIEQCRVNCDDILNNKRLLSNHQCICQCNNICHEINDEKQRAYAVYVFRLYCFYF